jgi:flagellar protein FlaF
MMSQGPHSTPRGGGYARAAGSYQKGGGASSEDQRDTEAKVLLKAARMIQELHDSWDEGDIGRIEKTIAYNRQIWSVFYDSALTERKAPQAADASPDAKMATKIRNNIVSLASFVFQRSLDIMAEPAREKLPVLITINREIAAGLMQKQDGA